MFAHNRIRIFNPILSPSVSTLWTIVQKDGHEFLEVHLFCHKVKCTIKLLSGARKHGLWMYILVTLNTSRKTAAFQNTCEHVDCIKTKYHYNMKKRRLAARQECNTWNVFVSIWRQNYTKLRHWNWDSWEIWVLK